MPKNILFIMCDQLRADYLSCYGHPFINTRNIDKIADMGVLFNHAYCQAPLCGPSRASFYTGRYLASHGASANADPLKLGELSLGDYLRELKYRTVLVGKSEVRINQDALKRIHIENSLDMRKSFVQGGFEYFDRLEGIYTNQIVPDYLAYSDYLLSKGYEGKNPWENLANSAFDERGKKVSGWQMRNSNLPSAVPEEHSETAYTTDRALEFLSAVGKEDQWCLHLSYIKPHWPYLVPSPYHSYYSIEHILPAVRNSVEKKNSHPVLKAFQDELYSQNFLEMK